MMQHREGLRSQVERAYQERVGVQCLGLGEAVPPRQAIRAPREIVDFWPGDLVIRVGAGMSLAELDRFANAHGFELGWTAGDPERHSVGACFAQARQGVGGCEARESVLSALVVDGRGRPLELGARVVKNVAGYDLLRLHHGAGGSLGALVEMTLRLRARPAMRVAHQWRTEQRPWSRALSELRGLARDCTVGEVLAGAAALEAWGLDPRAGEWLVFAEGGGREVTEWQSSVGGVETRLPFACVAELGLEGDGHGLVIDVFASTRWILEHAVDGLDDHTRWWWLDLRRGVLRVHVDERQWQDLRPRLSGVAYLVQGSSSPGCEREPSAVDATMRRIKAVWDPAEIFPPLPRALR